MAFIRLLSQPVLYCDSWELFVGKNNVLHTFFQACQIWSGMGTVPWCCCCSVRYERDFRQPENRQNTICCNTYSRSAVSRWQRERRNFWRSTLLSLCQKGWWQSDWSVLWSEDCSNGEAAGCGCECGWRVFCWTWEQTTIKFLPEAALNAWASLEKACE